MAGRLEVITGCMFCGKTEELIRRVDRGNIAGQNIILVKPTLDDRYDKNEVVTHYGRGLEASLLPSGEETTEDLKEVIGAETLKKSDVVAFDEGNFFSNSFVTLVENLIIKNKRVMVAGLDLTFAGELFHPMPELMAYSDRLDKLHAVCNKCGDEATRTQRLTKEGEPAPADGPTIKVGGKESYQARCRDCWELS